MSCFAFTDGWEGRPGLGSGEACPASPLPPGTPSCFPKRAQPHRVLPSNRARPLEPAAPDATQCASACAGPVAGPCMSPPLWGRQQGRAPGGLGSPAGRHHRPAGRHVDITRHLLPPVRWVWEQSQARTQPRGRAEKASWRGHLGRGLGRSRSRPGKARMGKAWERHVPRLRGSTGPSGTQGGPCLRGPGSPTHSHPLPGPGCPR